MATVSLHRGDALRPERGAGNQPPGCAVRGGGVKTVDTQVLSTDPQALGRALETLQAGGMVALSQPTRCTGWELLIQIPESIQALSVKVREAAKAIPVLLSSPDEFGGVAMSVSPMARRLARAFLRLDR